MYSIRRCQSLPSSSLPECEQETLLIDAIATTANDMADDAQQQQRQNDSVS